MKPRSCSRRLTLFECEAEFERDSPHWVRVYEPLRTNAPENARPHCFGIGEVDFYDKTGNRKIAHVRSHDFARVSPELLRLSDGLWYEVVSSECRWHNGQWCMVWNAAKNTRSSRWANHMPTLQDPPYRRWWLRDLVWKVRMLRYRKRRAAS